jgi:putative transposase
MANTYTRLIVHCVWSTKHREPNILADWERDLWSYIGGIARNQNIHPIQIGGIENHIHALVEPPKSMNLPDLLQILKTPSSSWINRSEKMPAHFNWQDGYGAFSVSPSLVPRVVKYIRNQREHHRHKSFEEEYRDLLRWHGIAFEEAYLLG